ncbi:hypothetical protein GQ55_4G342000 [Panicum hallii var. hallii]|uniref:Uncharacterized protein n=1 Tax=Panicum hallii var. hallii TaxID=1504633 RepID=A0A2T7E341_9POAL|nr:hypothetical protein GQ55_4G342000 [Panicum hallii var. hallii]
MLKYSVSPALRRHPTFTPPPADLPRALVAAPALRRKSDSGGHGDYHGSLADPWATAGEIRHHHGWMILCVAPRSGSMASSKINEGAAGAQRHRARSSISMGIGYCGAGQRKRPQWGVGETACPAKQWLPRCTKS